MRNNIIQALRRHQEQLYLEPQSMIVFPMEDGGFRVVGSMQCPFYIAHELGVMMDLPHEMIRVEQSVTGGAFGGKEDYPSFLAGYCAVLAKKSGKAVKMVLDRHEDMQYTPKRHPSWLRYRTGLSDDGRILAMDVDFILDGGAYTSVSPVVMYRGILHAALGYRCDHVLVKGHVYQSHTVPNGAFRGFGAPQAFWGLESHVDDLAIAAQMTPDAFRLKNALHLGDSGPTGQIMSQSMGSPAVLEKALAMSDFSTKWAQCSMGKKDADRWYGIGMSFFAHGACFTGDGESRLKSRAEVRAGQLPDGTWGFIIRASSTEMGQGAKTVLAQIAADGLHVPFESIYYPLPDTAKVPNTGPTCASRTTVVAGNTIYEAACDARNQLEELVSREQFEGKPVTLQDDLFHLSDGSTYSMQEVMEALGEEQLASIRGFHQFALPDYLTWDQETFKGDAYPAYSWACNIAEVEVDPLTLEIRLMKLHVCFDVGRLINPVLATGQVHGGLAQSFGYALMEHTGLRDGAYDASRLQTYIIPTMADMPEMNVQFVEEIYEDVEPGAKGMGEIVMNGVPPAVANALYRATGCRLRHLPMTPESLFEQISHPVPSNQEPRTKNQ
ncbi:MAG: hypothetical protein EOL87_06245 [Spartobacteria bacterium]|nr:hypothetical protein [Spartobacteria bacterium]